MVARKTPPDWIGIFSKRHTDEPFRTERIVRHAERRAQAGGFRVVPQNAGAQGVEGAPGDLVHSRSQHAV